MLFYVWQIWAKYSINISNSLKNTDRGLQLNWIKYQVLNEHTQSQACNRLLQHRCCQNHRHIQFPIFHCDRLQVFQCSLLHFQRAVLHICDENSEDNYTVSVEKQDTILSPITLSSANQFSKFFYCQIC